MVVTSDEIESILKDKVGATEVVSDRLHYQPKKFLFF
jgi:hypothetical protein